MQQRSILIDFAHVGSDGTFSGYASVFGVLDSYNTMWMKGCFAASVEETWPKMLLQHEVECVIGKWLEIREDDHGLFVKGQLNLEVEKARETMALMKDRSLDGLSVGVNILESRKVKGIEQFTKVDLMEISIVTFASVEEATVDSIQMIDTLTIDAASVRRTGDGYLTAFARAARTGIQVYKGSEVGRPDLEQVRVYRPEKEVFDAASLRSYAHRPMTNDHPPFAVDSSNWKEYSVGQTGDDVVRDGQFVRVPMVLMDAQAIKNFEGGKKQLSLGYHTKLVWDSGVVPGTNEQYDAVQTEIRANHLAVVANARGGSDLKIGDEHEGDYTMNLKTITVDGVEVQVLDVSASVITRHIERMNSAAEALRAKVQEEEDDKKKVKDAAIIAADTAKKAIETKDAEIATLKKQLEDSKITPAKLDDMVKDRATVIGKAKAVLGDKLVVDGKSVEDIQKQVVDSKMGDAAKGWTADQVATSFASLTLDVKIDVRTDRLDDGLRQGLEPTQTQLDAADKAYDENSKRLSDSWRNKAPAAA